MGIIILVQVIGLVINVCTFASVFLIQGFAGTSLQPPLIPPLISASAPQMTILPSSTPPASVPSIQSSYPVAPPPTSIGSTAPAMAPIPLPTNPASPPFTPEAPAVPFISPPIAPATQPSTPVSMPPNSHQNKTPITNPPLSPIAPVSNVPPSRRMPLPLRPSQSVLPQAPPPLPPVVSAPPASPRKFPPPYIPLLPKEPPLSPPERNASPILTPPPRISPEVPALPLPAPVNKIANSHAPVSHSPSKDPSASKPPRYSPKEHHHARNYTNSPPPLSRISPPPRSKQAPPSRTKSDPKVNLRHEAPPPTIAGSAHPSRIISPFHSDNHYSPSPAPSPSGQNKIPTDSPELPPSQSLPRIPKPLALPPPFLVLPPPPPQKDCGPLTCSDPLTYGLPESPCSCVLPIQVGLRVNIALYTFFPLVSELAAEIAAGVFMKQSQVRIMGANAAGDNPEKTVVLIDLIPVGEKFDDTTAYLTFQRLWLKQVLIKDSVFGDYDVLYVRYPGLPPSPPLPPSTLGVIGSKPYPGHGSNAGAVKPLGVDARRNNQHRDGPSGSMLATIVFSAFVAAILLCVIAWVLLFKHRDCAKHPDQTPANTIPSLTKSSGRAISMLGSGPSSPSFSLGGSSIAAYTGSAKIFSSSDIERATDFFNETRILGEGGFGRVYSGVFEDGTKVAMKVLKRCDQQGGREFLAEVEMLSRLHHRNLVKLIGICTEERTRCLVYELVPNSSVESHLHGIDKEVAPLDWRARLKIALGAARALAYLHEDSSPPVIHRDFKASNILLEDDFTPKVSDFGLARTAFDEENKHISTRVMGTFGYVAPEYAMTGHLLVKSDVYSYGVVLLELLTGKKPIDMSQPPGQENLVAWARPLLTSQEGLESLTDPVLGPDFPFDSIAKVAAIASMCVQPEVSHRPFMGEVVQALKLVCNECDEINKESQSRSFVHDDLSAVPDRLLSPPPVCNYDYRVDVERDVSMSELLSSSVKFGERDDCESFRRHSSSGPLRMGKSKRIWKMMGRLSRGSVSEHGVMFRLWPGSH